MSAQVVWIHLSGAAEGLLGRVQIIREQCHLALQLDDVPLDTVLDLLTKSLGLRWKARDGGVWIDKQ